MPKFLRSVAFPILIIVLLALFVQQMLVNRDTGEKEMDFQEFVQKVKSDEIKSVTINPKDQMMSVVLVEGDRKTSVGYTEDYPLTQLLLDNDVTFTSEGTGSSMWSSLLISALPILIIVIFWLFLMNQMQGGGNKVMSFGKSRAKRMSVDQPKVTFKDVAGVDEAVEELQEIKEFL
ncbi:MAG: ATP-dependent metallopeptidase FtsH/Yme1/Tma family protein, partial [Thermoleophilia bacterium]|nr:ATP-dependent metallopeptidase FtsH/Yme1/Tma family protein [Thermoleophilia bacterium]